MFCSIMTLFLFFSGYGDILPTSPLEQMLAVIVGLTGLLIFNYIISQIIATISGENAKRWIFDHRQSF